MDRELSWSALCKGAIGAAGCNDGEAPGELLLHGLDLGGLSRRMAAQGELRQWDLQRAARVFARRLLDGDVCRELCQ